LCCRKNSVAYREALRRLREKQQETVNTVDAAVVTAKDDKMVFNEINSTETRTKPKRRPSQTLLVKPKV